MPSEEAVWPEGYGLRVLAEVDSTLDEARRVASEISGPEWILALKQTMARGRRGRSWVNPEGNMTATLVLRPTEPPAVAALRSFIAALALFDAVAEVTGGTEGLALKWPNDVLLNGGKLAGILLESIGQGGRLDHLAIGIGVNLAAAPPMGEVEPGAVLPVSVYGETGIHMAPEAFLTHLARAYDVHEQRFVRFGFAPIRTAWLDRAARLGETITARTARDAVTGVFRDMDKEGHLVLETAKGHVTISAADVFF